MAGLKPPISYFGGKTTLAPVIAGLLPDHTHYVEPFCGSMAVLLAKHPSPMETVNDLDGHLMNFWRVLREQPEELAAACALTPHSRAEALQVAGPPGSWPLGLTDLERARRIWVRLTQCRGGHTVRRTGWRYYTSAIEGHGHTMPDYLNSYVQRITAAAARLHQVSLECAPALGVIRMYGKHPRNLLYVDPPYLESVRAKASGGRSRGPTYAHELRTDAEHTELLEALLECDAAVVVSGYASYLYDWKLGDWWRKELPAQTGNGGERNGGRARTEVVWSNRPFPQGHLF